MSEVEAVSANSAVGDENSQQNDKGVKSRKSKSPRSSTNDRAREEGEAIAKGLYGEVEGRRITRSAAKGVTATPPPPAKKERKSSTKGRGRPKKGTQNASDEIDSQNEVKDNAANEEANESKSEETKKTESQPIENNSHEEKEELANNNAVDAKEVKATENGSKEDGVDAASTSGDDKKEEKTETPKEDAARPATEAASAPEQPAE